MLKLFFLIFIPLSLSLSQHINERKDFKNYFDEQNVNGSILIYELKKDRFSAYKKEIAHRQFIPASTFKIFNTLAGLETGIIPDTSFIFKWNGDTTWNSNWNQDLKLKDAFLFSCVPCYQQLAREIGQEKMQFFIDKEMYGNQNLTGGIDKFWLSGKLRISQFQQIEFLTKLYLGKLSFSQKSMKTVKEIMKIGQFGKFYLSGKTGWAEIDEINYGWFVGYAEIESEVIFFALLLEDKNPQENFASARINVVKNILSSFSNKQK